MRLTITPRMAHQYLLQQTAEQLSQAVTPHKVNVLLSGEVRTRDLCEPNQMKALTASYVLHCYLENPIINVKQSGQVELPFLPQLLATNHSLMQTVMVITHQ